MALNRIMVILLWYSHEAYGTRQPTIKSDMKIKISAFLLFLLLSLSWTAYGTSIYPGPSYFQPLSGTNAYILSGTSASEIVSICGVDKNTLIKHWQPSKAQVLLINEKLNLKLENVDDKTELFKIIKLYFGLKDDKNKKYVYAFLFPSSKNTGITINFRDNSLVCPRLKSIAEFSLDKLELRMLKPDITDAFNGWRIKSNQN